MEAIAGENGLLKQLTKALLESALEAELTTHLGMRSMRWRVEAAATVATERAKSD